MQNTSKQLRDIEAQQLKNFFKNKGLAAGG